ncbi:hypothetical protein WA026_005455 [Henosepilachna vigintioctopunctata]|uniref:Uncharacterized protein n=1 Tax=Henosepilachna vigintioctopunctata TaxID=420089 RepID=A0AAW1U258_9CUCU
MCRFISTFLTVSVIVFSSVFSRPMGEEGLMTVSDYDTAVVESTVRETRQAVPSHIEDLLEPGTKTAYLEVFDDDDQEKGYQARTKDKGKDGYKKREDYHKKDSDSYGFEKHTEFGMKHQEEKAAEASDKGSETAPSHESYSVLDSEDDGKKKKKALKTMKVVIMPMVTLKESQKDIQAMPIMKVTLDILKAKAMVNLKDTRKKEQMRSPKHKRPMKKQKMITEGSTKTLRTVSFNTCL